jgi:D-amino-acid dehydrogenase
VNVIVLGAGVIGVTSAWYLAEAGHEVRVIDRRPGAGLETSFANGGQISVSQTEPWANPGAPGKILKWLGQEDAPLLFRPMASLRQWKWVMQFLYECLPGRTRDNTRQLLQLALYSALQLEALRAKTGIEYDQLQHGILQLHFDPQALQAARARAELIRRGGLDVQIKTPKQCLDIEPALARSTIMPLGGTFAPSDESGDAYLFTRNLAALCEQRGVRFLFEHCVERLEADGGRVRAVHVAHAGESQRLSPDAVLVCLGCQAPFLLEPLDISVPIYPVKGYSVTIPIGSRTGAPSVCLTDEGHKIAISRLGDRLRVAGTAELDGYDTSVNDVRCGALLDRVQRLFPDSAEFDRAQKWAGLRPATPGNVPLIGATPLANLFVNVGHGTLGWTLACGSGRAIADLMQGRTPAVEFRFRRP